MSLLRALGGWRRERSTDEEGLTLAGLLMLGRWPAIHEAAPYYFVDYQERPAESDENDDARWLDRVVPDGTWSGNLFDFYRRVVRKIVADLKVPFALKGDIRRRLSEPLGENAGDNAGDNVGDNVGENVGESSSLVKGDA